MALPKIHFTRPPSGGFFLSFATDLGVGASLTSENAYSPEHARIAIKVFEQRQGSRGVLIDVGANLGTFAIPVALATGCAVHAFEAQRVISQLLSANFVLSGIGNAAVHNVALGPPGIGPKMSVTCVDYMQPGNFSGFATDEAVFEQHSSRKMSSTPGREEVDAATLDSFGLEDVFFMKIDVEGAELEVLKGSIATLERNSFPPLLVEAWAKESYREQRRALIGFVEELGYGITDLGDDFLAQHTSRPAIA